MMEDALEVISQLMATDRFLGYRGKYFSVGENRNVLPKPLQKPHPPFWMARSSPESFYLSICGMFGLCASSSAKSHE